MIVKGNANYISQFFDGPKSLRFPKDIFCILKKFNKLEKNDWLKLYADILDIQAHFIKGKNTAKI